MAPVHPLTIRFLRDERSLAEVEDMRRADEAGH
jgi:hypothetical protein